MTKGVQSSRQLLTGSKNFPQEDTEWIAMDVASSGD